MYPLENIRVIEATFFWNGPYTGRLLAELGAEVIKIEPPNGDPQRNVPPLVNGISLHFISYNANKKFITLNLKKDEGRKIFFKLISKADVFIENFKPGTTDKLGISYEEVKKVNPKIIYVSTSGYGNGPYRELPGFDPTVEAMSGLMDTNGFPNSPTRLGMGILDIMTPAYSAFSILAALRYRDLTGEGQRIDMSMFDVGVIASQQSMVYFLAGFPYRVGPTGMFFYPEYLYRTRDGYVYVIIHNDESWKRLCEYFGKPEFANDERFDKNEKRLMAWKKLIENFKDPEIVNRPDLEIKVSDPLLSAGIELHRTVSSWFSKLTKREAMDIVNMIGGAAGEMKSLKDQLIDPHVAYRELYVKVKTYKGEEVVVPGSALKLEKTPGKVKWGGGYPLGYHNEEVYMNLVGLNRNQIEEYKRKGVI